jgi:trehalose 6-phosphate phosphatase
MKNILSPGNRSILDEFAWSNVLLAFDYDGTLAPIVAEPNLARMRRRTRDLLSALAKLYPVIIVSGRAQPDAVKRLRGVGVAEVVGNHGIEPRYSSARHRADVRRWLPGLIESMAPLKGVMVEDKRYSIAVHYRQSREKTKARAAILKAAASLGDVRLIRGKQVVNILPEGAPHKGVALERERAHLRCDTAIYVGDDETDEDVFALDQPGRLLAIRVGAKRNSGATYCVTNQRAVDDLLQALLNERRKYLREQAVR